MNKIYKFYRWNKYLESYEIISTIESVNDALMFAGELADLHDGELYQVLIFDTGIPVEEYTLMEFINQISPFDERPLSPAETEIIDNMNRAELREAVRCCPTEIILQELASRCDWMEKKISAIYDIICK